MVSLKWLIGDLGSEHLPNEFANFRVHCKATHTNERSTFCTLLVDQHNVRAHQTDQEALCKAGGAPGLGDGWPDGQITAAERPQLWPPEPVAAR